MQNSKKIIKNYFSDLAKKSHKKNPRPKEFYQEMQRKGVESRLNKKQNEENT